MVPAGGQGILPVSVQSPYIIVVGPNGSQNISNPLFSYIFDPLSTTDFPDTPVSLLVDTVPSLLRPLVLICAY
jgi:tyrosinase